jgi:hypothetical protein
MGPTGTLTYACSICVEPSHDICVYCTKDVCRLHRCQRCLRCSDCCECESPLCLDEEPAPQPVEAAIEMEAAPEPSGVEQPTEPDPASPEEPLPGISTDGEL